VVAAGGCDAGVPGQLEDYDGEGATSRSEPSSWPDDTTGATSWACRYMALPFTILGLA